MRNTIALICAILLIGLRHCADNGDFDARYYSLLQEYDPKGTGEKPSPEIMTVYMNPEDPDDFEKCS